MVETARTLNPRIEIVLRSPNEEEAAMLEREQAGKVFVGERELARSITGYVLSRLTSPGMKPPAV
jgi:CPA2 family monovalent cation:H+ antiporter-2